MLQLVLHAATQARLNPVELMAAVGLDAKHLEKIDERISKEMDCLQQPWFIENPDLSNLLDRYAETRLAKLPKSENLIDRIGQLIAAELHQGELCIAAIASRLGYSPRTLQRKLKEAGTSYQELLDKIRYQLAIRYLQERHIAISEVACLLSFSEASAFHRAFKRWTGIAPGEFRASSYDAELNPAIAPICHVSSH